MILSGGLTYFEVAQNLLFEARSEAPSSVEVAQDVEVWSHTCHYLFPTSCRDCQQLMEILDTNHLWVTNKIFQIKIKIKTIRHYTRILK